MDKAAFQAIWNATNEDPRKRKAANRMTTPESATGSVPDEGFRDRSAPDAFSLSLVRIAEQAGARIREIRATGFAVETKEDRTPVTIADQEAEALILAGLRSLAPDIPVIAEEEVAAGRTPAHRGRFFLVDPLDGTRDFVAGRPGYSVNIALVDAGIAQYGVIYAPAMARMFVGCPPGSFERRNGAFVRLAVRPARASALEAYASAAHATDATDAFLAKFPGIEKKRLGSAVKFGLIAAGEADLYARFGPTMEWDTAAGQCILEAAGGLVLTSEGTPLRYGTPARGFANPDFVAFGGLRLPPERW